MYGLMRKTLAAFRDPLMTTRSVRRQAIEKACTFSKGTLLDVGCGGKPYKDLFYRSVTCYYGLEHPNYKDGENVDIFGDALLLPIRTCSVDTVVCFEVLNYLLEPHSLFKEVSRILKPDGYFILTAPQMRGFGKEDNDFFRFTPAGLRFLTEQAGLSVLRIDACGGIWSMVGQRISSALYMDLCECRGWNRHLVCFLCGLVQVPGLILDRLWPLPQETLHYLVVARKENG
jgi:SAM-dependent methyltransferase